MRIIKCQQGSEEWHAARIGLPTASRFSEIVTPKTMKRSGSFNGYMAELLAEWFLGMSLSEGESGYMERGRGLEPEARGYYALVSPEGPTVPVGLCLTDDGTAGASPDSLVGDDGLLEVKCLSAKNHMYHVAHGIDVSDYWCQTQGQLFVTGRKWCDLLLYHPTLPSIIHRVEPDPKFQAALGEHLGEFVKSMAEKRAELESARAARMSVRVDAGEVPAELC